jgi:hypothetical protein
MSARLARGRLADLQLACFYGAHDQQGRLVWSGGELRIETVRRFKSRSVDAVVIAEVDFIQLGGLQRKQLFVALTRVGAHGTGVRGSPA